MQKWETGDFVQGGVISYRKIPQILEHPDLIRLQRDSFNWFVKDGMQEVFDEVSPIEDFTGNLILEFMEYSLGDPLHGIQECRDRDVTYACPLKVKVRLITKEGEDIREIKEQEIFMGDLPYMTDQGTFVINGAERVVVSQLVRSPGIYFETDVTTAGKKITKSTIIPNRGAWLEFESDSNSHIGVRIDKTRRILGTTLLRALGFEDETTILKMFDNDEIIQSMLEKDDFKTEEDALIEIYRKIRPGDPPSADSARNLLNNLFFEPKRYSLAKVGRYKLNKKLGQKLACPKCGTYVMPGIVTCPECKGEIEYGTILTKEDIISVMRYMLALVQKKDVILPRDDSYYRVLVRLDDIDHLGNRRIRAVGELLQNQFRVGLLRLERVVRERMTVQDIAAVTPQALINIRPVVAAIKEFFGSHQLSQFMDQTNSLAELTHKRRLSALGPGGLSRERAGFEVRDVHYSHYGRICPIETPEGPNIGLIGSLATYAKVNEFGFIMTPYRRVKGGQVLPEIVYLTADEEEEHVIAQANTKLDEKNKMVNERVQVRKLHETQMVHQSGVDFMDTSPSQIVSIATSLIPFLEHDDANRALMGANMQRQAVPLITPEAPCVGTGVEYRAASDSGALIISQHDGKVTGVSAALVKILDDKDGKEHEYILSKFSRSNAGTCINQRPTVKRGQKVKRGQVIADGASSVNGELSLGRNVMVAFMPWEGYNYEDAILISEELVHEDVYTSIHIEEYECEARDTKLGAEEITRDIPNVGEEALKELDERGVVRVGAEVRSEDILVGKVTPKGETELTAEERLLRAIFGEKARDVRDTSLKVPHGEKGKVIDVKVFSREEDDELAPGVNKFVRVYVAQKRKILQGDKMAGRHGNKGVIAKVLPVEDMPYLPDGTPVQIVLNPLGVPSRMNIGQILETHLGGAAYRLGVRTICPVFDSAKEDEVRDLMKMGRLKDVLEKNDISLNADELKYLISDVPQDERLKSYLKYHGIILTSSEIDELMSGDLLKKLGKLFKSNKLELDKDEIKEVLEEKDMEGRFRSLLQRKHIVMTDPKIKRMVRYISDHMETPMDGKTVLYDGRTGESFEARICVGHIYMLKLAHLVDDKIHARSTGPYSLITQQPLGGKAQFGGQRFGEMEVWALEAYGAAYTLQELLTVKSDDVVGRVKTYEAIVKGENVMEPGVPESFKVLVKELQSLALDVKILSEDNAGRMRPIELRGSEEQDIRSTARELGLDLGESALKL
ncbi:MAG: DNA-directed RNA polymerase subunit beta [Chloroflexi bacterium]|nr:DNA-directed RNA polymerase subunit beta [Chloroflexota bacterium]